MPQGSSNFSPALFIGCGALLFAGLIDWLVFGDGILIAAWFIVAGVGVLTGALNIFN